MRTPSSPIRGRLAPSPTGALHLGNARSFMIAWLSARSQNGTMVMRMEDLDHPKVKPGSAEATLNDLRWLGLDWDEGPDSGGSYAPYIQSKRTDQYRAALSVLREKQKVYPCTCSRSDVATAQSAPHEGDDGPRYQGTCRNLYADFNEADLALPKERSPAWRFCTNEEEVAFIDGFQGPQHQQVNSVVGDFVLARHANGAGYMLAVVVDDAAMKITEVIRGDDLLSVTHRQLLLYKELELQPPEFTHVPLVVGIDGRRLAKRHGDTRIASLRDHGVSAEKITGLLAYWCGWAEWGEELTPQELIPRYNLSVIPSEPVVVTERIKQFLAM